MQVPASSYLELSFFGFLRVYTIPCVVQWLKILSRGKYFISEALDPT